MSFPKSIKPLLVIVLFLAGGVAGLLGYLRMDYFVLISLFCGITYLVETKFKQGKILALVALSFILAISFYGKVTQSKLGIIDDHEIALYLGGDRRIAVSEIIPTILSTEVGRPGVSLRYRPSYYVLRVLESALWSDNTFVWYSLRILILGGFVAVCWWILSEYIGITLAGLFILNTFRFTFWDDLFTRLGPAETYAALGMTLYLWGGYRLIKEKFKNKNANLSWTAIYLGTIICAGSKENFILLVLPLMYGLYRQFKNRAISKFVLAGFIVTTMFVVYISGAVIIALQASKADIYGSSVDFGDRLNIVIQFLSEKYSIVMTGSLVGLLTVWFVFRLRKHQLAHAAWTHAIAIFILYVIFLSQYLFYNGHWPNGIRYDFPGILTLPLFVLVNVVFFYKVASKHIKRSWLEAFMPALVMLAVIATARGNFAHITQRVRDNINLTTAFQNKLFKRVASINEQPYGPVIIAVGDYNQFEYAVSYARFLRYKDIQKPVFLSLDHLPLPAKDSQYEQSVYPQISAMSVEGLDSIQPLSNIKKYPQPCLEIQFPGKWDSKCQVID